MLIINMFVFVQKCAKSLSYKEKNLDKVLAKRFFFIYSAI